MDGSCDEPRLMSDVVFTIGFSPELVPEQPAAVPNSIAAAMIAAMVLRIIWDVPFLIAVTMSICTTL